MGAIYRRPAARRDLTGHFVYLFERAGEAATDRFPTNAATSFDALADRPAMGSPLVSRHAALALLRKWRVLGFDRYLIFHLPRRDGVSIIRVLHAASDWRGLLERDGR